MIMNIIIPDFTMPQAVVIVAVVIAFAIIVTRG